MRSKKWDPLICLALALVLLVFVLQLKNTKPMARVYPMVIIICSYVMLALTMVQWVINWKKGNIDFETKFPKSRVVYIVIYIVSLLGYVLLLDKIGYIPLTIIYGIFSLIYLKCKNKVVIVVLPIVVTILMYLIFSNLLYVTLPPGLLKGIL